jgi:hypothetical protein
MENALTTLSGLDLRAAQADIVTWQGRQALRLQDGLALLPARPLLDASVTVWVGVDGPAYPGVAFRLADLLNFELAYPVPHVSGQWDALQYDPVFHASNTWQLHHGPAYQRAAQVPLGRWFRLKVDYCADRAAIFVDDQPPLVVERLAHPAAAGRIGLWTFRPAYFCDLRVSPCAELAVPPGETPPAIASAVGAWFVEGYGVVTCEPNGLLNLNRYLPASLGQVRLVRRFELAQAGEVEFGFGFSDVLSLQLDGEELFSGEHTFHGFADRASRGYVEPGMAAVRLALPTGAHHLVAELRATEGFGWGLVLTARGPGLRWLPVELG